MNILRGGGGRASVVSMVEGDESAYGSVSGRSSLVSTLDRFFIPVKNNFNLRTCFQEGEGQTARQLDASP